MKTINVATAFQLILKPGQITSIPAGLQLVEDEVADHWYTKQHLAEAGVGTAENVDTIWAAASVAWDKARATGEAYEALVLQAREAEAAAGVEARDPPHLGYIEERVATEAVAPVEQTSEPEPEPKAEEAAPAAEPVVADAPEVVVEAEAPADADTAAPEAVQVVEANPMDHDLDGGDGGSVAVTSDKPFDEMSDDELRTFITERDSKAPHHNAGRGKLLDIARKEDGAGE